MKRIDWLSHLMTAAVVLALSIFGLISTAALGLAQSVDIVRPFDLASGPPDAGLIQGQGIDGFLYGTTRGGGTFNGGTVFKILPDGTGFSVIHSFQCATDGCNGSNSSNSTGLIQLSDGSLYGTTSFGGEGNGGTVFTILPDGTGFSVIHSFQANGVDDNGSNPMAGLIQGQGIDGFLYGTTPLGGAVGGGAGVVFKILPNGTGFSVIHRFQCLSEFDCSYSPVAGLIQLSDGSLYGTTAGSAGDISGTVFKMSPDGTGFNIIHTFRLSADDGRIPLAGLIQGIDGFLYGTARDSGASEFGGTVFKIRPDGTGFSIIHRFPVSATDGTYPLAGLIELNDGFLYGTTRFGGTNDTGTVFKISPNGSVFNIIHSFPISCSSGGCHPEAGLIQASDGNLYSTTPSGSGTIYRVVFPDTVAPDTSITSGPTGTITVDSATFTWTGTDNLTSTPNLVYAYRLGPIEASFSTFGSATTKSYTNLPNGSYTFYVKAKDQTGNEDPEPATRSFMVNTTVPAAPDITVTPTSLGFGAVLLKKRSAEKIVTVKNDGTLNLSIGSISLGGANANQFSTAPDKCSKKTLAPGASCTITAHFRPTTIGAKTATLIIPSNDPDENPANVSLSGTGTP